LYAPQLSVGSEFFPILGIYLDLLGSKGDGEDMILASVTKLAAPDHGHHTIPVIADGDSAGVTSARLDSYRPDLVETFCRGLHFRGAAGSTIASYRRVLVRFDKAVGLAAADTEKVRAYVEQLINAGVTRRYVAQVLCVLSDFYRALKKPNPTESVREGFGIPKAEKGQAVADREQRAIREGEAPKILATRRYVWGRKTRAKEFRISRDNCIYALLGASACRIGELAAAKISDLDLEQALWWIPTTKTGVPRYAPLNGAVEEIRAYLDIRAKHKGGDSPALLVSQLGKPMSVNQIRNSINRMLSEAGAKTYRRSAHAFRHLRATQWSKGHPIPVSAKVLGNSPKTMLTHYLHIDPREAAQEIGVLPATAHGDENRAPTGSW
jgi:integrase